MSRGGCPDSKPFSLDATVKEQVRQQALALGFNDCRFTSAASPESAPHLDSWLAEGFHGEMGYLARNAEKRKDPSLILPGARSVIALALSYFIPSTGQPAPAAPSGESSMAPSSRGKGIVARYARFADYHDLLGGRLKELCVFLDTLAGPSHRSLWYVDTGPVLERDLAQRAGLGFVGKHTNLIGRRLGNWFLIGEILTTVEFESDRAERNRCGSCKSCLTACPTEAIVAPFRLDARRCISYLTLELKGSIPIGMRRSIGNRIFGCDDCLAVCPWNRFAAEGHAMKSSWRPDLESPDLLDLLRLDDAGFRSRFHGTPLWRSKRRGLLRNVCVALGNVGGEAELPALVRACVDPEPIIAEHARWAVEEICGRRSGEMSEAPRANSP